MRLFKEKNGFTLVELLVAMAIIGMLIALVYAAVGVARRASRDTARKSDLQAIQLSVEDFYGAENAYPEADQMDSDDDTQICIGGGDIGSCASQGGTILDLSQRLDGGTFDTPSVSDDDLQNRDACEAWCDDGGIGTDQAATTTSWNIRYLVDGDDPQVYCLVTRLENNQCFAIMPEN